MLFITLSLVRLTISVPAMNGRKISSKDEQGIVAVVVDCIGCTALP